MLAASCTRSDASAKPKGACKGSSKLLLTGSDFRMAACEKALRVGMVSSNTALTDEASIYNLHFCSVPNKKRSQQRVSAFGRTGMAKGAA